MAPDRTRDVAVEACACGGWITADRRDLPWVASAVHLHQLTARHIEWQRTGGIVLDPELLGREPE